ncbi:ABC transporter ATP-binding protein [Siculibacillus lacustris]|uniref:ABC transporter ATP-binding protein n=1 Tax=Siculibacillus lacustris TaxID=1549641 RepID=A0A4Q9VQ46_9HYPH|nr:ABC transporter ATP-binding protein [Siculibacillus lacustris]TBW37061.1 ABC transporter ATP-binding protein [Siculibacillus lacustris]
MVALEAVDAGYGEARVLFELSLEVAAGEVVTLMGRNGMGKTTTIRTLFGLIRPTAGRLWLRGRDRTGVAAHVVAREGLGLVPEGRQIFPRLTVEENLVATASTRRGANWTLAAVHRLFPRLAERRRNLGDELSGGEQQMLAIGRALMTNPDLLVLDEATEGLAPVLRDEIWAALATLKAEGLAILVVDKHLEASMRLSDRHIVMEKGRIAWAGRSSDLAADRSLATRFLEL